MINVTSKMDKPNDLIDLNQYSGINATFKKDGLNLVIRLENAQE